MEALKGREVKQCPECSALVESDVIADMKAQLSLISLEDALKPTFIAPPPRSTSASTSIYGATKISVKVALLGGDTEVIDNLTTDSAVADLMAKVEAKFRMANTHQRLVHERQELKYENKLSDYSINEGSTIYLMKLLLETTRATPYRNINFVITWQQLARRVYLDASCICMRADGNYSIVDFKHPGEVYGVTHSGPAHGLGNHTLRVDLNSIATDITHLFFVMSACRVPTLSDIRNPAIALYETSKPHEQISNYNITTGGGTQSVIMCCLKRTSAGFWKAFTLDTPCKGNCYEYHPILRNIGQLFERGVLD